MNYTTRAWSAGQLDELLQAARRLGSGLGEVRSWRLSTTPLLSALRRAGTLHVYGDTADVEELERVARIAPGVLREEIDGNTANQPLVHRVIERYVDPSELRRWDDALRAVDPTLSRKELLPWLYALICARIGNDFVRAFACGRTWESSLQLHMGLVGDPHTAVRIGELLAHLVPGVLVKVPFAPDAPHCLLVARELERRGIPVNFTSTFSARQVVAAALLADATRTNVFLGRLDQGLHARGLGEHVVLEAQHALSGLRHQGLAKSQLIAASVREWTSFPELAGCDAFTAPCKAIEAFVEQTQTPPEAIVDPGSRSGTGPFHVEDDVRRRLGEDRLACLHSVGKKLLGSLAALRRSPEWAQLGLDDGEELRSQLDDAGCGDLFHAPTAAQRDELARAKLPQLDGDLIGRIALDTHYSLLANADFARHQAEIDERIESGLEG